MKYTIVIERAGGNYSAYVPDLPGCVATGASIDETKQRIAEAIAMHIEGRRAHGLGPPVPTVVSDHVGRPRVAFPRPHPNEDPGVRRRQIGLVLG